MKLIVRVLLFIILPIWFFFSRTWIGNNCMIPICIGVMIYVFKLIFLIFGIEFTDDAIYPVGFLSFLLSPLAGVVFIVVDEFLKVCFDKYKILEYKD